MPDSGAGFNGPFDGTLTGTASNASAFTVANEATDTTCFVVFVTAATGSLAPKSNTAFIFNSNTGQLSATTLASTVATGTAPLVVASTTQVSNLYASRAALADAATIANEASDATCFVPFVTAATGDLPFKSNTALTFDSSTGTLGATIFQNAKIKLTPEGGMAVLLTAGETLALGNVVYIKQTDGADGKVWKNPVDSDMPIGVAYHAASADASVWVVVSGIVSVLPESGVTATRGYVIYSSNSEAGTVDQDTAVPAALVHFREVGHWLDTGSGAGVATRAIIHFN